MHKLSYLLLLSLFLAGCASDDAFLTTKDKGLFTKSVEDMAKIEEEKIKNITEEEIEAEEEKEEKEPVKLEDSYENPKMNKNYEVELYYDIYAIGIKSYKGTILFKRKDNNYEIKVMGKPVGIVDWFTDKIFTAQLIGEIEEDNLQPKLLQEKTINGKKVKKEYWLINDQGNYYKEKKIRNGKTESNAFDLKLTKDAKDYYTLVYALLLNLELKEKCILDQLLFDGKRTLKSESTDKGKTNLRKGNYFKGYDGKAKECTLAFQYLKGEQRKDFLERKDAPIVVYFASIAENLPKFPAKINVKGLPVGSINMYLKDYKIKD
jgi:hypothetical protein